MKEKPEKIFKSKLFLRCRSAGDPAGDPDRCRDLSQAEVALLARVLYEGTSLPELFKTKKRSVTAKEMWLEIAQRESDPGVDPDEVIKRYEMVHDHCAKRNILLTTISNRNWTNIHTLHIVGYTPRLPWTLHEAGEARRRISNAEG